MINEVRVSPVVLYPKVYAKALASRRPLGKRGLSDSIDFSQILAEPNKEI
ncbi:MAG: hypothetical protein RLZZ69_71 [Cyanobacteriota bacterium]|jgi:hypothetical protein